jgi:hypothetical protein
MQNACRESSGVPRTFTSVRANLRTSLIAPIGRDSMASIDITQSRIDDSIIVYTRMRSKLQGHLKGIHSWVRDYTRPYQPSWSRDWRT